MFSERQRTREQTKNNHVFKNNENKRFESKTKFVIKLFKNEFDYK